MHVTVISLIPGGTVIFRVFCEVPLSWVTFILVTVIVGSVLSSNSVSEFSLNGEMQMKVTASPTVAFFDSGGTVIKVEPSKPLFGYSEIETNVLTYCNNLPAQYRLTTNKIC